MVKPEGNKREHLLTTRDGDEIDYHWYSQGNKRIALISHGLGGNNQRAYVLGMAKALLSEGWDVIAWNFRASGSRLNKKPVLYHAGASNDLEDLVLEIEKKNIYKEMVLLGFSVGGNINLLYLGKKSQTIPQFITKSICFSVPCDLKSCALELEKTKNKIYLMYFLRAFKKLLLKKKDQFPKHFDLSDFESIKTFRDFDNRYTAPLHGFKDAEDYWKQCSCKQYLKNINKNVLLVMAEDDPFLGQDCYPFSETKDNKKLTLLTPQYGGHVGFVLQKIKKKYWSEVVTIEYLNKSGKNNDR